MGSHHWTSSYAAQIPRVIRTHGNSTKEDVNEPAYESIAVLDENTDNFTTSANFLFPSTTRESGSLIFSSTAVTPEPGTAVLWLKGIGLVLVMMRKLIAQGLHGPERIAQMDGMRPLYISG
jgi:hypothetical protein